MKNDAKAVCFRLDTELVEKLKEQAKEERRSATNLLECILDDYFKKIEEQK